MAYERFAISRRASGEDLDACAMAEFTRIPSASPREELSKVLSMAEKAMSWPLYPPRLRGLEP